LGDSVKVRPESGARLFVESESGNINPTFEEYPEAGSYYCPGLLLDPAKKHRLRITTANQKTYVSDFVAVRKNSAIDSVSWKRDTSGVTIFANTHNPENSTRYYRWEYEETWQIRSAYFVNGLVDDGIMEPFYPGESVYYCWKQYISSNINLATTTQLSSDVIFEKPLLKIRDGDDRLSERYTVLVRQYALDEKGYAFYQQLKKNTESLGSIFDAQPTEITGNVHGVTDTTAKVIGYITATSVDSARIWIKNGEVQGWKPWADCTQSIILNTRNDDISSYTAGHEWIVYAVIPYTDNVYLARAPCVSCRVRGGSTHRPSWWP
jgi:hypothetical protein